MADDTGPVPLRLPAILQNPTNTTLRQVEAYKAQQREKAIARKEAAKASSSSIPAVSKRGKRVVRRMNNATFVDNPHAVNPKRTDLTPSVPLHYHPLRPSFPAETLERNATIPSLESSRRDPLAPSSKAGAFSTSLKGTRAMLRRRGRRAETFVPTVEDAVRSWLGGEFDLATSDLMQWQVLDATQVDVTSDNASSSSNGNAGPSRRLPSQHQVRVEVPSLPVSDGKVAAVLELSRSPAHLSWAVPDSFDRLVVHLVARYYDLVSWSEDQTTADGQNVRLTHIVRPALAQARVPSSNTLVTPEISDISAASASDTEHGASTESDTPTEVIDQTDSDLESDDGDGDTTFHTAQDTSLSLSERFGLDDSSEDGDHDTNLPARFGDLSLDLQRTTSHGSSAYASSEGGFSDASGLDTKQWQLDSPVAAHFSLPTTTIKSSTPRRTADVLDKPTFFEYLFGE